MKLILLVDQVEMLCLDLYRWFDLNSASWAASVTQLVKHVHVHVCIVPWVQVPPEAIRWKHDCLGICVVLCCVHVHVHVALSPSSDWVLSCIRIMASEPMKGIVQLSWSAVRHVAMSANAKYTCTCTLYINVLHVHVMRYMYNIHCSVNFHLAHVHIGMILNVMYNVHVYICMCKHVMYIMYMYLSCHSYNVHKTIILLSSHSVPLYTYMYMYIHVYMHTYIACFFESDWDMTWLVKT